MTKLCVEKLIKSIDERLMKGKKPILIVLKYLCIRSIGYCVKYIFLSLVSFGFIYKYKFILPFVWIKKSGTSSAYHDF